MGKQGNNSGRSWYCRHHMCLKGRDGFIYDLRKLESPEAMLVWNYFPPTTSVAKIITNFGIRRFESPPSLASVRDGLVHVENCKWGFWYFWRGIWFHLGVWLPGLIWILQPFPWYKQPAQGERSSVQFRPEKMTFVISNPDLIVIGHCLTHSPCLALKLEYENIQSPEEASRDGHRVKMPAIVMIVKICRGLDLIIIIIIMILWRSSWLWPNVNLRCRQEVVQVQAEKLPTVSGSLQDSTPCRWQWEWSLMRIIIVITSHCHLQQVDLGGDPRRSEGRTLQGWLWLKIPSHLPGGVGEENCHDLCWKNDYLNTCAMNFSWPSLSIRVLNNMEAS